MKKKMKFLSPFFFDLNYMDTMLQIQQPTDTVTGKCIVQHSLRRVVSTGNGYCRSETVGTVFLQKSSDAKRVYATVVHTGTNADGNKEQGEKVTWWCYLFDDEKRCWSTVI